MKYPIGQIVEGHTKLLLNLGTNISEIRMNICKKCPLYAKEKILGIITDVCSTHKYLNPDTNEVSTEPKPNFHQGCGCNLKAKTRVYNAKCIINKW